MVTPEPTPSLMGAALHNALWAMRTHNGKALADSGITGPQAGVLWFLHEYRSLSLKRLAELQGTTPANMTGVVRRLEREGLVSRRRAEEDTRRLVITLTPEGDARTRKARRALDRALAELFEGSTAADLAATLRVLEQIRKRAETVNPKS